MALKSAKTALAVAIQASADVFASVTTADLLPISQLGFNIEGVTIDNDEYLGSVIRNAPDISGKRCTLTFNTKLRPPGGTLPAANAFIPGRLLQAAKFTEIRTTAAIPVAPEALGVGSTTSMAKLGATATGTLGLYKGFPLILSDNGSGYKAQLTAIRSYLATKDAELMELLGGAPAANYQIPTFLGYHRSIAATDPTLLSKKLWLDGHRFDLVNCRVTGLRIVIPTTTRDQASYPELQWTVDCRIYASAEEATPTITPLGAVPLFRNGDMLLNRIAVGTSTFTVDLGIQTEDPPNPNKLEGVDASEMVGSVATVSMTKQKYLPTYIDPLALADAQAQIPMFAQWGAAAAAITQIVVPDCRPNYASPDLGGNLIMENGDLLIDAFDRSLCINFPY